MSAPSPPELRPTSSQVPPRSRACSIAIVLLGGVALGLGLVL